MSSPAKKKAKRAFKISFKTFVLACEVLSVMYGFEGEDDKIQWDYEKNGDVLPENVAKSSNKKFWFWCPKCKHSFQKPLYTITNNKQDCGFCAGKVRCQSKECAHCYATSFANAAHIKPERAEHLTTFIDQWSDQNGDVKPWMVSASKSDAKFKFDCQACGHTIEQRLHNLMNGRGCGYCRVGSNMFCGDADCQHCWDRSVAGNPMKQAEWNTEANRQNGHEAITTARCSNDKFVWTCPTPDADGTFHTFKSRASNVAKGRGCRDCQNKTEMKVKDFLTNEFGTTLVGAQLMDETGFDWCKNKQRLPFDIILVLADGTRIIIEVDGPQHYERVPHFNRDKSLEEIQYWDRFKERRAVNNGHSLIRLKQVDVWNDTTDWRTILLSAISLCQRCEGNIVVKTY